jgi:hypothetical protein
VWFNIVILAVLIFLTTGVHAGGMILALKLSRMDWGTKAVRKFVHPLTIPWFRVSSIVLLMFIVAVVEVTLWAFAYQALGAIDGFEPALYFSMVTFTTLGYGEIVLDPSWRLIASYQAAIGIIMFGWTTAIVIASVQQFYFKQEVVPELQIGNKEKPMGGGPNSA